MTFGLLGRRRRDDATAAARQDVRDRLRTRLVELAVPCVRVELATDDVAGGPTGSRLGDDPYPPEDYGWPVDEHLPLSFVAQIHFADAPPLGGFPDHGLLQWSVSADDTHGLTFDETQGTTGFVVRWFDDLSAPSTGAAADDDRSDFSPVVESGRLVLTAGTSLPAWA
ncbi:MAG: DUF1963 domain-containing protein, partial [Janthinobacterium lividum]